MSSILKALQRLERETSAGRKPRDPSQRQLRRLVPQRMAGRSRGIFLRRAAFTAFILFLLGGFSWTIWRYAPPLPGRGGPPPAGTGAGIAKTDPHPSADDGQRRSPAPAPPEHAPPATTVAPAPPMTKAAPKQARPATVPRVPATAEPHRRTAAGGLAAATAPADQAPGTSPAGTPAAAVKGTGATKPPGTVAATATSPETAERSSHDDLPVKSQEETGMAIQALVWSPTPEDRLVVVNGSILKEGGSIDGASVAFIGEDYIVVQKGGARWKLKFQIQ